MRNLIIVILLFFLSCTCSNDYRLSDDFYGDLGTEDLRIAGELYLDYFDENLTNLTYDYYIQYVTKTEAPSAEGLAETIKSADGHYLIADTANFYLGLYFAKDRVIVCDYSGTAFTDSVKELDKNDTVPELMQFVEKVGRNRR